jgi:hypothetical protein
VQFSTKTQIVTTPMFIPRLVGTEKHVISVADPDPGSGASLTPGSGTGKKSGSGMNIPDHISDSLETVFRGKNTCFGAVPDPGCFLPRSRVEKFGSGINIPDPQHCA